MKILTRRNFDEATEKAFQATRVLRTSNANFVTFLAVAFGYNLFLLTDLDLIPDVLKLSAAIRFCVITPLMILFVFMQKAILGKSWLSHLPGRIAVLLAILMFSSVLGLQALTREATAAEYFTGCFVVLVAFNSIRYGSFTEQLIGTVGMCIIFSVVMPYVSVVAPALKPDAMLSFYVSCALTLVGAHRADSHERAAFLAEQAARELSAALSQRGEELAILSLTDQLTNIPNRRAFDIELSQAESVSREGAVLMIDVDFFKKFNDRYGHAAGDFCLSRVAQTLRAALRPGDFIARYGGEEFAVILKDCGLREAAAISERLRQSIEQLLIPHDSRGDGIAYVTVSIGGKARSKDMNLPLVNCINEADAALYISKKLGRNRAVIAKDLEAECPVPQITL